MSKFCGNCGTVMDDAAAVCGNCGAPLAPAAAPAKKAAKFDVSAITNQVTGVINGVKKGDKNAMIKGGIAVAAVVVVLILIISLFSSSGEEKLVKKFIKAYDKENAAAFAKLVPPYEIELYEEAMKMLDEDFSATEDYEEEIEDFYEYWEEELDADGLKLSYKIEDCDEVKKSDLKNYADRVKDTIQEIDSDVEFKKDKVKKGYEIEVEVTVKGGGDKDTCDLELYVIKYGSKWYVINYEWSF